MRIREAIYIKELLEDWWNGKKPSKDEMEVAFNMLSRNLEIGYRRSEQKQKNLRANIHYP